MAFWEMGWCGLGMPLKDGFFASALYIMCIIWVKLFKNNVAFTGIRPGGIKIPRRNKHWEYPKAETATT